MIRCAVVALLALFAIRISAQAREPTTTGAAVVPFSRASGLVYVEVAWGPNGQLLLALLDTGANASAIDPRVASHLPVEKATEVVGTTGSVAAEVVAVTGLALGPVVLPTLHATRRNLNGLLSLNGRPVDLILGSDAFLGRAVTLDFRRGSIELGNTVRRGNARSVSMRLDNGIPAIAAELEGLPVSLRIDTGASLFETNDIYVNIPTSVWGAIRSRAPALRPSASLQGIGADGHAITLPVVRLTRAIIGSLASTNVFIIVQPEMGYFASPQAIGFVSNNFLEKLGRVTLDFRAQRLWSEH